MHPQLIIERFGSPAYVYQLAVIERAYEDLTRALPTNSHLYYSLKSNPHPSVVRHLLRLGARVEVSSPQELQVAIDAGANPHDCLYTGPGKTDQEIIFALEQGVEAFSVESWTEAERLSRWGERCGRHVRAILRLNPMEPARQAGLSMSGIPSQFGLDEDGLEAIPAFIANNRWLSIVGLHIYQSTNLMQVADVEDNLLYCIQTMARVCRRLDIRPALLDLGGGFGAPFGKTGVRPDFSSIKRPLEAALDEAFPLWRQGSPQIAFESGRYLTAEAGTLITTVMEEKVSKQKRFIIVDTGIHHIGGMSALGRIRKPALQLAADQQRGDLRESTVVGPLCTPLDYLVRDADLPSSGPGDYFTIPNVGAYALTASLIGFLSRDAPVEVVIHGERLVSASRIRLSRVNVEEEGDG